MVARKKIIIKFLHLYSRPVSELSYCYGCLEFSLFFGCDENSADVILAMVSNQTPW